ncbi:MAG: hypothetical protein ACFFDN_18220 [Candidatus Hodarchaeota archaeon]
MGASDDSTLMDSERLKTKYAGNLRIHPSMVINSCPILKKLDIPIGE